MYPPLLSNPKATRESRRRSPPPQLRRNPRSSKAENRTHQPNPSCPVARGVFDFSNLSRAKRGNPTRSTSVLGRMPKTIDGGRDLSPAVIKNFLKTLAFFRKGGIEASWKKRALAQAPFRQEEAGNLLVHGNLDDL